MKGGWWLRTLVLVGTIVVVDLSMVSAGMGPRLMLVGAGVVLVASLLWFAFDVGNQIGSDPWRMRRATRRRSTGTDWRVSTMRLRLAGGDRDVEDNNGIFLYRALVGLIDDRLLADHEVDRRRDPDAARAIIGPDLTRFVESGSPPRRLTEPRVLASVVTLIEKI